MVKYYVRGKEIDDDDWDIETDLNQVDDYEDGEYVTDRHGKIIGVGYEYD